MKYMVEHRYIYGWDDAGWSENDLPWRFDSVEAAQAEIDETVQAANEAGMEYDAGDYRVVPVPEAP